MYPQQKLHEELHSFREAIAGSADWDNPQVLRNRCERLIQQYLNEDSETARRLAEVKELLKTLEDNDLQKRVAIDNKVCDILNWQENGGV